MDLKAREIYERKKPGFLKSVRRNSPIIVGSIIGFGLGPIAADFIYNNYEPIKNSVGDFRYFVLHLPIGLSFYYGGFRTIQKLYSKKARTNGKNGDRGNGQDLEGKVK